MVPRLPFLSRGSADWLQRLPALPDARSPRELLASLHARARSVQLPSPRLPRRREVGAAGALALALALAYLAARETSLFAVETITVRGGDSRVTSDVRGALSRFAGKSLASVDADELERRLVRLSSVRSAEVDRAFPHELEVVVRPEKGLAVVRTGADAWVVGESGRVIEGADPRGRRKLPRIRVTEARLGRGGVVSDPRVRELLAVLRALPERFPVRVLYARAVDEQVTLVLAGWVELRLGEARDAEAKLRAAARVLETLSGEERQSLGYLDVTLPERPVAAGKNVTPPNLSDAETGTPAAVRRAEKPSTRTSDLRVGGSQGGKNAVDSENAPTYAPPSSSRG